MAGSGISEVDVVIVGAGSAGIAAGRHLRALRPDLSLQILEAGHRLGGRAYTADVGPDRIPVDLGCGWLHGGRDNAWMVIAARTGFTIDRAPASWDGGGRDFGLSDADSAAARQALADFFEAADAWNTDTGDVPMSAALEAGNRWNGLLEAIGTFINGAELEYASLRDYQNYSPGRGPDPRVREGYGRLVASYGSDLPVMFGATATRIDHGGRQIRISTAAGTITARAVIVTVPSDALATESLRFDPPLQAKTVSAAALPLGLCNKLFLAIPDDIELPAEHYIMGSAETVRTASYHIRPFGRPIVEGYFGGQLARDMEREGALACLAFAQEELGRHLTPAIARRLTLLRMSTWASAPNIGGSYSYARPGEAEARTILGVPVNDRLFFAGEACSPTRFSTAHGAYETGVAAAEAVAASRGFSRARERERSVQR